MSRLIVPRAAQMSTTVDPGLALTYQRQVA
jgi:hypothetical protein